MPQASQILRALTADAEDRRQADFGVLMRRNVDTSNTCHGGMSSELSDRQAGLSLALLVTRVGADHANHTLATDDLAVAANFLDRS
jgi:hypothetical protein